MYYLKCFILIFILVITALIISIIVAYYELGLAAFLIPHFIAGMIFQDVHQRFKNTPITRLKPVIEKLQNVTDDQCELIIFDEHFRSEPLDGDWMKNTASGKQTITIELDYDR